MAQIKVYVESTDDMAGDLRRLGKVRYGLWQSGLVQGAPLGAHRDRDGHLFFRLRGDFQQVRAAVDPDQAKVELVHDTDADECVNCGNRPGDPLPTVCTNCGFRDITPCPNCQQEVPRQTYEQVAEASLYRCPRCTHHVRLEFNPDLFDAAGQLHAPAVVVRLAEA